IAYSRAQTRKIEHAPSSDGRSLSRLPALPDHNRRRAFLAGRLDHGDILFSGRCADLKPLRHLLRNVRARVDLGIVEPLKKLFSAKRTAAPASAESPANRGERRVARPLSRCRQGRIYLARVSVQLRPLALCRASVFALLSSAAVVAWNFSARRQNAPDRQCQCSFFALLASKLSRNLKCAHSCAPRPKTEISCFRRYDCFAPME